MSLPDPHDDQAISAWQAQRRDVATKNEDAARARRLLDATERFLMGTADNHQTDLIRKLGPDRAIALAAVYAQLARL